MELFPFDKMLSSHTTSVAINTQFFCSMDIDSPERVAWDHVYITVHYTAPVHGLCMKSH